MWGVFEKRLYRVLVFKDQFERFPQVTGTQLEIGFWNLFESSQTDIGVNVTFEHAR